MYVKVYLFPIFASSYTEELMKTSLGCGRMILNFCHKVLTVFVAMVVESIFVSVIFHCSFASLIAAEAISYSKLSQVRKWLNFVLLSFWFLSFFWGGEQYLTVFLIELLVINRRTSVAFDDIICLLTP